MSESLRSRTLLAAAASIAALLLFAAAGQASPVRSTVSHRIAQSPSQVRAYWTPERMRDARPLDGPFTGEASAAGTAAPSAAPPDQEIDPGLDTTYPYRIHGRLFLRFGAGDGASCSATVVTSFTRNLILTAGHCVALPQGGGRTLWATDLLFVPAYRNGSGPFGTYPGISAGAPVLWAGYGDVSFDAGVINLAAGAGGQIQDQLGSRGVGFNRPPRSFRGRAVQIFGYPAEPAAFYDGERPILCNSRIRGIEGFSGSLLASPCNQQQGASGGGWVLGGSIVTSLTSHAGCRNPTGCQVVSGTYLGDAVFKLWSSSAGGLPRGRKKRIAHCRHLRGGRRDRCLSRAETFQPVVR